MNEILRRYLIVSPAWVGDMVMAQTLFKMIKHSNNNAVIDVLAPSWSLAIASRMPEVRRCIKADFAHGEFGFSKRYQIGKSLRKKSEVNLDRQQSQILETKVGNIAEHLVDNNSEYGYDEAIVLPNSFKSALIPYFANIGKRTGYVGEFRYGILNNTKRLDKLRLPRTIDRFCYLFDSSIIDNGVNKEFHPQLTVDSDNQRKLLDKFDITNRLLVICPGAEYGPSKQWEFFNFAKIAKAADAAGYCVVALGSEKDSVHVKEIQKNAPELINLAGKTSLLDAVDILAAANKVLTNDSGLMHIAAAVGSEVFAIYGSTTPSMTPPLTNRLTIIETDLHCRPCFERECKLEHHDCMKKITPNQVWSLLGIK